MRPELLMSRQVVPGIEPVDPTAPKDMESGRDGVRLVQRDDREIDGFWLMINLDPKRRSALLAEFAMAEAGASEWPDLVRAARPPEIPDRDGSEGDRRRSAEQLAGPAMAPAGIERIARQLVANGPAKTPAGPRTHRTSPSLTTAGALPTSPATNCRLRGAVV